MANSNAGRPGGTINEQIQAVAAAGPRRAQEDAALVAIAVDDIGPHPDQPRTVINRERQKELKASLIKTRGVMTPVEVRRAFPEELKAEPQFPYRLIAGQRRLEAYRELRAEAPTLDEKSTWSVIRAIVKLGVDEADALERALIENIQRDELLPLDEAEAYARIKAKRNLRTVREVAAAVGKKEERVKDLLRLHDAPDVIKQALRTGLKVVRADELGEDAAREKRETLRRLDVAEALKFMQLYDHYFEKHGGFANRSAATKASEATRKVIERALLDGWSSRRVDEYVKSARAGREATPEVKAKPAFKSDGKQFVVYRDRVGDASEAEKAELREALTDLLKLVA